MASLSLQHIDKTYPNGYKAVKDFNLEIADKEFIIFVGPSGCGKSTTLRMVAGLEDITGGTFMIDGKVMNDVEPKDRDIAMVFQNYALYPHMTVYDNMAFGLKLRKVPKDEIDKKVKEAAKILDLDKLLDRKPKALSGGQRQRVAMGRAIVRAPKVFLMDEPLSNLDAKLRVQMRTEISKLHQRLGATIIYVTHDQTEAMTLGTRIVVMKDGVVQQIDTPQNLYDHPCNQFVAGFIGSPQMNFMDGKVKVKGNDVTVTVGAEVHDLRSGPCIRASRRRSIPVLRFRRHTDDSPRQSENIRQSRRHSDFRSGYEQDTLLRQGNTEDDHRLIRFSFLFRLSDQMRRIALLQSSFFQIIQTIQISQIIWIIQILAGYAAVTDNDADRTMVRHSMAGEGSPSAYGNQSCRKSALQEVSITGSQHYRKSALQEVSFRNCR